MFKIHTSNGDTHRVDFDDEEQSATWSERLKHSDFQKIITGVSIVQECVARMRCPSCKRGHLICKECGHELTNCHTKTGVQYSLSKPDGFGPAFYLVECVTPDEDAKIRGGERISCFVGDSRLSMMVHRGQPSVRVTLLKTGRQRYNPFSE